MATGTKPTTAEPVLVGLAQVAEMLGVSRRHVLRLRDAGDMPRPIKLGSRTLWRRSELLAWIDGGCKRGRA
jgi:excisionase family DNA binding protein